MFFASLWFAARPGKSWTVLSPYHEQLRILVDENKYPSSQRLLGLNGINLYRVFRSFTVLDRMRMSAGSELVHPGSRSSNEGLGWAAVLLLIPSESEAGQIAHGRLDRATFENGN